MSHIVFIVQGSHFSSSFMICWTSLVEYCKNNNIQFVYAFLNEKGVYSLNNVLGGNLLGDKNQSLFNNKFEYNKIIFIDSNILFTIDDVKTIIEHDSDVVTGLYLGEDSKKFQCADVMNDNLYKKTGSYKMMNTEDIIELIQTDTNEFVVEYTELNFLAIKKGVFEKIGYPWFSNEMQIEGKNGYYHWNICFCKKLKEHGINIHVLMNILFSKEKLVPLTNNELGTFLSTRINKEK